MKVGEEEEVKINGTDQLVSNKVNNLGPLFFILLIEAVASTLTLARQEMDLLLLLISESTLSLSQERYMVLYSIQPKPENKVSKSTINSTLLYSPSGNLILLRMLYLYFYQRKILKITTRSTTSQPVSF